MSVYNYKLGIKPKRYMCIYIYIYIYLECTWQAIPAKGPCGFYFRQGPLRDLQNTTVKKFLSRRKLIRKKLLSNSTKVIKKTKTNFQKS